MRPFLLSCCFLFLFNVYVLEACGYSILGEGYRIALLDPYLAGDEYSAFFYSTERLNHGDNAKAGRDRIRNAEAWAAELGYGVSGAEVMRILYGTSLDDWLLAKGGGAAKLGWGNNRAWQAISQRPDLLEYALWAKGYEKPDIIQRYWGEPEEEVVPGPYTTNFKARARAGYAQSRKNSFLADRYGYQLLLIAYYEGDDEAMDYYFKNHFKEKNGALADWARFHFAGQWNEEGRYLIEMANAFRRVPEKSLAVYNRTDQMVDPAKYLSVTRNDAERSNLYALAALKRKGKALDLLRQAYTLDPTNPVLDLLVVREFNKVEDWLMTYQLTHLGPALPSGGLPDWEAEDYEAKKVAMRKATYVKDRAYLKQLRTFIHSYRSAMGAAHFNEVLRAQAALLDEDYTMALRLTDALVNVGRSPIGTQVKVIRTLALLQSARLDHEEVKNELAGYLLALEEELGPAKDMDAWTNDGNLRAGINRAAAQAFAAARDTVSAYFLHNRSLSLPLANTWSSQYYDQIRYLDRPISPQVMQAVITIIEQEDASTPWMALLQSSELPEVYALHDLAGTLALRRNDLGLALHHFAAVPYQWYRSNYEFNSYLTTSPLNDMWLGNPRRLAFTRKVDVVRQLMQLEKVSKTGGEAGAAACLALGKAWYNMSHLGEAWMMLSYGNHLYEPTEAVPWPEGNSHPAVPHSVADYHLIHEASRALGFFNCATTTTNDPEVLAEVDLSKRIIEMNIQINQRDWDYLSSRHWEERMADYDLEYEKLMRPFVLNHRNTALYQAAVMQCSSLARLGK
ncbi:hypothetical protein [Neolewinella persica]|uniref:hypothetical protein n=1 Tax=Neolewinella persica TaxID=70998 RepID=UPI000378A920|nr:hypothetical protein [Neolewinella persica]